MSEHGRGPEDKTKGGSGLQMIGRTPRVFRTKVFKEGQVSSRFTSKKKEYRSCNKVHF